MIRMVFSIGLGLLLAGGCMRTVPPPPPKKEPPKQAQKQPKTIVGRKTQDIGKYDPAAGWEVSDSKVEITNPNACFNGPAETASLPFVSKHSLARSKVTQAVSLQTMTDGP